MLMTLDTNIVKPALLFMTWSNFSYAISNQAFVTGNTMLIRSKIIKSIQRWVLKV